MRATVQMLNIYAIRLGINCRGAKIKLPLQ